MIIDPDHEDVKSEGSQPRDDGLSPAFLAYLLNGGHYETQESQGRVEHELDQVGDDVGADHLRAIHLSSYHLGLAVAYLLAAGDRHAYAVIESLQFALHSTLQELTHRGRFSYADYRESDHWRDQELAAMELAGSRCQVCHSLEDVAVSHTNLDALWEEHPDDVVVLCRRCHTKLYGDGQ